MQLRYKTAIAVGFVGAVVAAATAFGQTGIPTPGAPGAPGAPGMPKAGGGRMFKMGQRVVHSESKIQTPGGGFAVVVIDGGEVTKIDGKTVTIKRADGETVSVTAADATKVRRNGQAATVTDLKTGDKAQIVQVTKDGTTTVRLIRAFSADFVPKQGMGRGRGRVRPGPNPAGENSGDAGALFGGEVPAAAA